MAGIYYRTVLEMSEKSEVDAPSGSVPPGVCEGESVPRLSLGFWRFAGRHQIPWWLSGKESAHNAGDPGLIPGSGRSPGEGNDYPLQSSCLENPMDRGAWRATVHGVAKSQTNSFTE